jgi:hypothetical protein
MIPKLQSRAARQDKLSVRLSQSLLGTGLASVYYRTKDVRIGAVIIAELKLRDVQRQIFFADFVKAAHDPAFQDRPKAFDRVGVDGADDVLPLGVIDNAVIKVAVEALVATKGIIAL